MTAPFIGHCIKQRSKFRPWFDFLYEDKFIYQNYKKQICIVKIMEINELKNLKCATTTIKGYIDTIITPTTKLADINIDICWFNTSLLSENTKSFSIKSKRFWLHPDFVKKIEKLVKYGDNEEALKILKTNNLDNNFQENEEDNLDSQRPDMEAQEEFVFDKLDYYVSTYDYRLIAEGFATKWDESTGEIMGDADFKNSTYRFLEKEMNKNYIPQNIVDDVIDLILEYMESIGQY